MERRGGCSSLRGRVDEGEGGQIRGGRGATSGVGNGILSNPCPLLACCWQEIKEVGMIGGTERILFHSLPRLSSTPPSRA